MKYKIELNSNGKIQAKISEITHMQEMIEAVTNIEKWNFEIVDFSNNMVIGIKHMSS